MAKLKDFKKALELRKNIKKRKPNYVRTQTNQYARFKNDEKWRAPKGYQNKIRLQRRGHIKRVQIGYGSPNLVKGANKYGLFEKRIFNIDDIKASKLEKNEIFLIGRTVGGKKRLELLKFAKENKIKFANIKDIDLSIVKYTKTKKDKKVVLKSEEKPVLKDTKKTEDKKPKVEKKVKKPAKEAEK